MIHPRVELLLLGIILSWVILLQGAGIKPGAAVQQSGAPLKVYSSHLNWGARRDSFDPLLNTRCPASFKFFFLMIETHERSTKHISAA